MKIISLFLLTVITSLNLALSQNSIQLAVDQFAKSEGLNHASISFKLMELETGAVVSELNPDLTLPTASTAKLFSTATALEILGPDYRAKTRIYHDGVIDSNGVLSGNIWIRGGGDPTLGSKYFNSENNQRQFLQYWVEQLKKHGISSIQGAIIADASEFGYNGAPDGWNWVDLGNYYGAGPSGLSIFDNLLNIHFNTSGVAGNPAKINSISPDVPGMLFHNYILSSTRPGDNAYIYGAPYSLDRFGTGTLPVNSGNFLVKGSLPDPEFQCAYEFGKVLLSNNITVSGGIKSARQIELDSNPSAYVKRELIYTHNGEKLIDIINETNMRSVNLFAEHMINLIGYEKNGNGSTESGLKVLEDHWKGKFKTDGLHINDGSGLSRTNAISAGNFVDLLQQMSQSKYADEFYNSLPIAGVSGTLRNVCKNQTAQNKLAAKSGSMTRIKSYAGYIRSINGKNYAFALIVNNHTCSSGSLRNKMETIFNKIASF